MIKNEYTLGPARSVLNMECFENVSPVLHAITNEINIISNIHYQRKFLITFLICMLLYLCIMLKIIYYLNHFRSMFCYQKPIECIMFVLQVFLELNASVRILLEKDVENSSVGMIFQT